MSSATPIASSVLDVLLKTSAPMGSIDRTAALASSPDSTTRLVIPLRSSAPAAAWIRGSEASWANSATAAALGPRGAPVAAGTLTSVATDFGETPMDQRDRHRSLPDRGRTAFDRPAPHVPRGEQPGPVGLERQRGTRQRPAVLRAWLGVHIGAGPQIAGLVLREPERRESSA